MNPLVRLYWRHATIFLLLALPLAGCAVLGVFWLYQAKWILEAFIGTTVLGSVAATLGYSIRRSKKTSPGLSSCPEGGWAPMEIQAWAHVQQVAAAAQADPPQDLDDMHQLAHRVVTTVAQQLHAKSEFSWANFTVPELLLAMEHAAAHLRQSVRTRVPGAEQISGAHLLSLYQFYLQHRSMARFAWNAYRAFRAMTHPVQAAIQELNSLAQGAVINSASDVAKGWGARLFVEELGRSAINLYAGRYRLSASESAQAMEQAAPAPSAPVPIRILLAGQVNAGKSSLTNALLGAIASPISELPTPGGAREFRIAADAQLDLVVVDSVGLTSDDRTRQAVLEHCDDIDLIIWVVRANHPARDLDATALRDIRNRFAARPDRRAPEMLLVMTHIDRLSPVREWTPPYDLGQATNAKAAHIRDALVHVAQTLGLRDEPAIPVALRAGEHAYNIDALWAAIGVGMNEAQLTALDRELKRGVGFSLATTFSQCRAAGRFVVGRVWDQVRGVEAKL